MAERRAPGRSGPRLRAGRQGRPRADACPRAAAPGAGHRPAGPTGGTAKARNAAPAPAAPTSRRALVCPPPPRPGRIDPRAGKAGRRARKSPSPGLAAAPPQPASAGVAQPTCCAGVAPCLDSTFAPCLDSTLARAAAATSRVRVLNSLRRLRRLTRAVAQRCGLHQLRRRTEPSISRATIVLRSLRSLVVYRTQNSSIVGPAREKSDTTGGGRPRPSNPPQPARRASGGCRRAARPPSRPGRGRR